MDERNLVSKQGKRVEITQKFSTSKQSQNYIDNGLERIY
jgi:hypothetical protein